MSRESEIKSLKERSRRFLETAEFQFIHGFYDLASFSLEQALQLFIKARLLEYGVEYPRTHSVRRLLEIFSEVAPKNISGEAKALLNRYILELGMLEDAYITSRYIMREFRREEVEKLKKAVEEVIRDLT